MDTFPEQHRNLNIFIVSLFSKFTLQICFYTTSFLKKKKKKVLVKFPLGIFHNSSSEFTSCICFTA